jgi:hypothetical protein
VAKFSPRTISSVYQPSRTAKAELIRVWCQRASEGYTQSRASRNVTLRAAARAIVSLLTYLLAPRTHVDAIVLAHADRGASRLSEAPYIGKLADRLRKRSSLLFLQMQPLEPTANVVAYPWLAMRIMELIVNRWGSELPETDRVLASDLAGEYGISLKQVQGRVRRLNFELRQWRRVLGRYRPRKVVLVDGYSSNAALIWTARQMGIVTIEVQHGACGRSHMGYLAIGASPEPLAPDYFLAWNAFWRDRMLEVPGYVSKIKVCPATAQLLPGRVGQGTDSARVLLIHQPIASRVLRDLITRLPDRTDMSTLSVKFHPSIQPEWQKEIERLCERKGIAVLRDVPIADIIGDYDRIVGWFSTVLSQAAAAGHAVNYLPTAGFEAQQRVLDQFGVRRLTLEEFLAIARL